MRISDWSSDVCSSDLMRARGDLRYHAAIGPVLGFLPRDAVRADAPLAVDKRRRGFVAARFEAEDQSHDMALPYPRGACGSKQGLRSEEHTSELQSLMRISYAVFCLKTKTKYTAV